MIHQFATRVTPITNHQFYIQAALILAVIAVGWMMLRTPGGARHMAARRLVTLAFVAFAVFNITFPWVMSSIAHRMGVGRGTDFLLYALVIAFLAQISPPSGGTAPGSGRSLTWLAASPWTTPPSPLPTRGSPLRPTTDPEAAGEQRALPLSSGRRGPRAPHAGAARRSAASAPAPATGRRRRR